jgi:hypothetical protein
MYFKIQSVAKHISLILKEWRNHFTHVAIKSSCSTCTPTWVKPRLQTVTQQHKSYVCELRTFVQLSVTFSVKCRILHKCSLSSTVRTFYTCCAMGIIESGASILLQVCFAMLKESKNKKHGYTETLVFHLSKSYTFTFKTGHWSSRNHSLCLYSLVVFIGNIVFVQFLKHCLYNKFINMFHDMYAFYKFI